MQYLVASQKQPNDLGLFPRQTMQHHSNPRLCPNYWCRRSWSWSVLSRPTSYSKTNIKKQKQNPKHHFHHRRLEYKVRNQEMPGVTSKFGLGVQRLTVLLREHTGHSKLTFITIQEMNLHIDITRWSIPKANWLYSLQPKMKKIYSVSKNKIRSWQWLRSLAPYCKIQA